MRFIILTLSTIVCGADRTSFQNGFSEAFKERRNMRRVPQGSYGRLSTMESLGTATSTAGSTAMLVALHRAVIKGGEQLLKNAAGMQTQTERQGTVPTWVWGFLLTLFGSIFTSLGLVLQKLSHDRNTHREPASRKYYLEGWWMAGFAIWISAQVLNLGAMGLAPQAMLSCLGSWTIICNIVIARIVLGEQVGCTEVMAMLGLLFGCALVVVGAPHEMSPHVSGDVHTIWALLVSRDCLALTMTLGVAAVALKSFLSEAVYWVGGSAVLTGFTTLLFKCVSLMLVDSPSALPSPWVWPQAYVILACALFCGVCEIHTLNLGLRAGKVVVLTPIYQSVGMLAQILTSGILLHEFGQFASSQQAIIFFAGVSVSVGFLAMLTSAREPTESHKL